MSFRQKEQQCTISVVKHTEASSSLFAKLLQPKVGVIQKADRQSKFDVVAVYYLDSADPIPPIDSTGGGLLEQIEADFEPAKVELTLLDVAYATKLDDILFRYQSLFENPLGLDACAFPFTVFVELPETEMLVQLKRQNAAQWDSFNPFQITARDVMVFQNFVLEQLCKLMHKMLGGFLKCPANAHLYVFGKWEYVDVVIYDVLQKLGLLDAKTAAGRVHYVMQLTRDIRDEVQDLQRKLNIVLEAMGVTPTSEPPPKRAPEPELQRPPQPQPEEERLPQPQPEEKRLPQPQPEQAYDASQPEVEPASAPSRSAAPAKPVDLRNEMYLSRPIGTIVDNLDVWRLYNETEKMHLFLEQVADLFQSVNDERIAWDDRMFDIVQYHILFIFDREIDRQRFFVVVLCIQYKLKELSDRIPDVLPHKLQIEDERESLLQLLSVEPENKDVQRRLEELEAEAERWKFYVDDPAQTLCNILFAGKTLENKETITKIVQGLESVFYVFDGAEHDDFDRPNMRVLVSEKSADFYVAVFEDLRRNFAQLLNESELFYMSFDPTLKGTVRNDTVGNLVRFHDDFVKRTDDRIAQQHSPQELRPHSAASSGNDDVDATELYKLFLSFGHESELSTFLAMTDLDKFREFLVKLAVPTEELSQAARNAGDTVITAIMVKSFQEATRNFISEEWNFSQFEQISSSFPTDKIQAATQDYGFFDGVCKILYGRANAGETPEFIGGKDIFTFTNPTAQSVCEALQDMVREALLTEMLQHSTAESFMERIGHHFVTFDSDTNYLQNDSLATILAFLNEAMEDRINSLILQSKSLFVPQDGKFQYVLETIFMDVFAKVESVMAF